ncbi:hypothetical protein D3C85_879850 [compost metagenome]
MRAAGSSALSSPATIAVGINLEAPPSMTGCDSWGGGVFVVTNAQGFAVVGELKFARHVFADRDFVSRRGQQRRGLLRP